MLRSQLGSLNIFLRVRLLPSPQLTRSIQRASRRTKSVHRFMERNERERQKAEKKEEYITRKTKLRGLKTDEKDVRTSKTLSWILRHGSSSLGLPMRADGYVKVEELVSSRVLLVYFGRYMTTREQVA